MIDIFEQARKLISPHLIESYFNCDKAYWRNGEFWTTNPLRSDGSVGSFSISEQGYYKDFAYPDMQGDFIDLVSKYFNLSPKESAEKIIDFCGGVIPDVTEYEKKKKTKKEKIGIKIDKVKALKYGKDFGKLMKSDYVVKDKQSDNWKPVKSYKYYNYDSSDILFYVVRYEAEINGVVDKKFCQFHLNDNEQPKFGLPTNLKPYSLYNINSTINNDLPVIIVEGEKCANVKIPGYHLVTFGASHSIGNFDFKHLKKKIVYILPDNDEAGIEVSRKIKEKHVKHAIILNISKLNKPAKWDIADAEKEGLDLPELIESMKPIVEKPDIDIDIEFDPEWAADLFLKDRFNHKNLDKIDGIFWRYFDHKHYWDRIDFSNIKSDIQIFLREKGFFNYAGSIDKSKKTFKNDVTSFIQDHSQGYFKDNPFITAAIMPYINLKNGVIKINDDDFDFISRDNQDEDYFRKLYPINCFEFEYKKEHVNKINYNNIQDFAPTFYYYVKSIVPNRTTGQKIAYDIEIKSTLKFVCQMIAYCMSPIKKRPYFFSFYGDEDTAKSSLFHLVREFIGDDFIVNRSISDVESSRFATSDLWGAKLFIDEDMEENSMIPSGFIKKYSGNQTITTERKNENAQHGVKISIAMFFISNYKLKSHGIEGLKRRAIIAKFENKVPVKADGDLMQRISGKKPHNELTPEYEGKTFDEREYIIHLIMQEWVKMAVDGHKISTPIWIQKSTDNLLSEMTSTNEYLKEAAADERIVIRSEVIYKIDEIFGDYSDWCKEQGRRPKGKNKFEEEIRRDTERIDKTARQAGKRKGVYKILFKQYDDMEEVEEVQEEIDFDKIPF